MDRTISTSKNNEEFLRVFSKRQAKPREWERDYIKHVQTEIRLDSFYERQFW